MLTREQADRLAETWLDEHEVATLDFDLPLPRHEPHRVQRLVVTHVEEHEFGWVYFYDGSGHVATGKPSDAVVGNAPLIVDKSDGHLYIAGTAHPLAHYLEEYRRGIRTRA